MTRTPVRRRRTAAAGVAIVIAVLATSRGAGALGRHHAGSLRPPGSHEQVYVVRAGDTVWSIARRVEPGTDPRQVVAAIADRNGIDAGSIVPGQSLVIPPAA